MPRARRSSGDLELPSFASVPRPGGGPRLLVRLPERDARAYGALVGAAVPAIETSLGPGVVGNRALPGSGVRLEPLGAARARRRAALRALLTPPRVRAVLVLDVADFYPSVSPDVVERALRSAGAGDVARALGRLLRSLSERGVRGLPVGPDPSAVLANAVLAPLDRALRGAGLRHLRWVDDVLAPAEDASSARRGLDLALRALDGLGLAPNPRKSRILLEPEEVRRLAERAAASGPRP
ncbi:MAG TPA: RNA-directed DNA polymerase [Actinomycetota bacterium]|nr:RNA-directed DNA polymerase [Actinomycetota bacterium]